MAGAAWAGGVTWHESVAEAVQAAQESRRPILIEFHSVGCGPCAQMEEITLTDEAVTAVIARRFEAVRVSGLAEPDIATRFLVSFYPTVKFIDADGTPVYDCQGFVPPAHFLDVMTNALGAHAALRRARAAAAEQPAAATAALAIARDFRTARQYYQAADWAKRALAADDSEAVASEAKYVLGAALTEAGEPGGARQPLIDALKLADGAVWQWDARLKLGYVWLQRGEEDSGIGLLQTVHTSDEAAPEVRSQAMRLLRWWGVEVD